MYLFIYQDTRNKLDTVFAVFSDNLSLFTGWHTTPANITSLLIDSSVQEPQATPDSLIKQWGPFSKFQSVTYYQIDSIESLPTLFPELFL